MLDYDCGILGFWSLAGRIGYDMIPLNNDFYSSHYFYSSRMEFDIGLYCPLVQPEKASSLILM
jgi:hypothetical protein